ncbi:homeobox protein Nkx-6.3-like [Orbicella faveolata]|uniref:homeobox protein Nkx-6.3-like n=1 Tax=Orbicella faveolata TaxID=48498 RepID=UPI0009E4C900|nr:homeobox protein Nkx-6.3-like [Orbicella faveolata]
MMNKTAAEKLGLSPDEECVFLNVEKPTPAPSQNLLEEGQLLSLPSEDTASGAHKPKIARTRFSIYQKIALENSFLSSLYLTGEERDALAFKIGLSPGIVQTWFKNRRFKWRKELKMANGTNSPPSPVLLFPNPPALTYRGSTMGPEHQRAGWEGNSCQFCVNSPPRFLYNNTTH